MKSITVRYYAQVIIAGMLMKEVIFKEEIATHLKALRAKQGLSLDATAKLTGVSKAMLGQIERQESSPTISTLWKIASGLNASFSAFFAHQPSLLSEDSTFPEDKDMKVTTLFPFQEDTRIEMFKITLTNYHQQMSTPHSCGVIEHIHVLTGNLQVYFDKEWHHLAQGESIRFHSDQEHGYKAVNATAVFQNIVYYPK